MDGSRSIGSSPKNNDIINRVKDLNLSLRLSINCLSEEDEGIVNSMLSGGFTWVPDDKLSVVGKTEFDIWVDGTRGKANIVIMIERYKKNLHSALVRAWWLIGCSKGSSEIGRPWLFVSGIKAEVSLLLL